MTAQIQSPSRNNYDVLKYAFALVPAITIYVYRFWFVNFDDLCIGSFMICGMSIAIVLSTFLFKNHYILIFCIVATFISIFAPRPIPEKIHLALHRSEYQAVVELARTHKLGHKGDCQYAFVLPDEYSNLGYDKDKCIFVEYEPAFVVEFEPLFHRQLLVYAETPEAVKNYVSCGGSDGLAYSKIEENWYICLQDRN